MKQRIAVRNFEKKETQCFKYFFPLLIYCSRLFLWIRNLIVLCNNSTFCDLHEGFMRRPKNRKRWNLYATQDLWMNRFSNHVFLHFLNIPKAVIKLKVTERSSDISVIINEIKNHINKPINESWWIFSNGNDNIKLYKERYWISNM